MDSVSVITVVLNDVVHIESTIHSVLSQKKCSIEYIVIDGGSTDGTLDVIEKYRDQLSYVFSGRDGGIYDAMNKGVNVAENSWAIFINSGDCFASDRSVFETMSSVKNDDQVVCGAYWVDYGSGKKRLIHPGLTKDLWKRPVTSHQATFVRTGLIKMNQFDLRFSLAADHALISKLHSVGCNFHIVPFEIACVSAAGVSDMKRSLVFKEFSEIAAVFSPDSPYRLYFFYKNLDEKLRALIKKIIPQQLVRQLQLRRWNR